MGTRIERDRRPQVLLAMRGALSREVRTTAFRVEGGAKLRAPVDTGYLRNSIAASEIGWMGLRYAWQVGVGALYGVFLEFGTSRMRAKPFLFPALREAEGGFMDRIRTALKEASEGKPSSGSRGPARDPETGRFIKAGR